MAGTERFTTYPAYRESGVEWLGEVPVHWTCLSLARVTRSRCDGPFGSGLKSQHYSVDGVRVIRLQNIGGSEFLNSDQTFVDESHADALGDHSVLQGDLLVAGLGDDAHPVGRACVAPEGLGRAIVKADCFRFRLDPRKVVPEFAAYQLSANALAVSGYLATGSTRSRMNLSTTATRKIALPPVAEQHDIVRFLNRKKVKFDAMVTMKERLVELLQEKRSALISRAIAKGLDSDVPMKDSGVQWLGKIPAYWQALRLLRLTPSDRGIMYGIVLPGPNVQVGVPIVKGGDVSSERLCVHRLNRTSFEIEARHVRSRLRGGDLVYAIRGSIGDVAIVPDELEGANLTQDAARVAYTEETHGRWLLYALKSLAVFSQLESGALGATIRGVNIRDLKRVIVPIPPNPEQRALADYLDRETERIDALLTKVREAIDRLKELRTAVIAAAVTGKIDVRETPA